jgi:hypothetical protein
VRQELERVEIPGEGDAQARAWAVVGSAFDERVPVPRPSHWPRVAAIAIALAAVLASAFSPPGQAVIDEIREVVGVERAERALFSLPAEGRLLVASDEGVWVVQQDGSKRLLRGYREASWSPFGRFIVAARRDDLAALEPDGDVRWTLPRPGARSPRWAGTETDTRIAYVDRTGIRVVAGDGTGDRLLVRGDSGPIAWRPGIARELALASARELRVVDVESGRTLWRWRLRGSRPTSLSWSANGSRLLVSSSASLRVYGARGALPFELGPGASAVRAAALAPNGRSVAYAQETDTGSQLWIVPRIRPDGSAARRLFAGARAFDSLAWSPDGRWLLASWPAADQWLFIRANGRGVRAVSNISEQFRSGSFPRVEGWCCAP